MKFIVEQTPSTPITHRTYSLYDIQDRIDYFEKKKSFDDSSSSSSETLENVLVNTFHQTYLRQESYGSALSRTMMNSSMKTLNDGKRSQQKYSSSIAKRVRAYSLTNQSTMAITATTSFSEEPTQRTQETVSVDGENTYFYPEETTRIDDVISLTSITPDSEKKRRSSVQRDLSVCSDTILFPSDTDENSQVEQLTVNHQQQMMDENNDENFTGVVHATKYTVIKDDVHPDNPIEYLTDEDEDQDQDQDQTDSDSTTSDSRYTSIDRHTTVARNSCASDDLNTTSSTLRQEAISITKVRCKRRKTWIRSSTSPANSHHSNSNPNKNNNNNNNHLSPNCYSPVQSMTTGHYLSSEVNVEQDHLTVNSNKTIDEVHSRHSTRVQPASMLLHNSHLDDQTSVSTYDIILVNNDTKDAHPSLSPVKRLLNESIDSNIEIIQMDEQECVLEIVDGVLTIVPKEKLVKATIRASSIASSSISSSSLSEHEHDEFSSIMTSKVSPPINELDLFSMPLTSSKTSKKKKNLSTIPTTTLPRSSSPIHESKTTSVVSPPSIKDSSRLSIETRTSSNKSNVLNQLLQSVKKIPAEKEIEYDFPLPKASPPPRAKPLNKNRINDFSALLSSSIHLTPPSAPINKSKTNFVPPSPLPPPPPPTTTFVQPDRQEKERRGEAEEEEEQVKKHIDARYNERIDDRKNIRVKTANIKALFEEKISTANRTLSQSTEHLVEQKSTQRKATKIKRNSTSTPMANLPAVKDVVIEDKPLSKSHEEVEIPVTSTESLIAREIRLAKEKEEELKRQRKKCGLKEEMPVTAVVVHERVSTATTVPKSSSFLSNLDFFTSKANGVLNESSSTSSSSPRRSICSNANLIYDSQHSIEQVKTPPTTTNSHENSFGNLRISSSHVNIHRATSPTNQVNIIQREIEAIRAKEAELRELGRIQHTSDEHSDPRKYQECLTTLPKSQSTHTMNNGKHRRENEKRKSNSNVTRGKSVVTNGSSSMVKSFVDRIQYEKDECQQRERELKQRRHWIPTGSSSINGDSGNVSQEEHDEDQERYFEKIQRIKRTELEKSQIPLIRPTKKFDLSQKWEQMIANRVES